MPHSVPISIAKAIPSATFEGWHHLIALRQLEFRLLCPDLDYDGLNPHYLIDSQTFLRFPFVDVMGRIPSDNLRKITVVLLSAIPEMLTELDWSPVTAAIEYRWPAPEGSQARVPAAPCVEFLLYYHRANPYRDQNMPRCMQLMQSGMRHLISRDVVQVSAEVVDEVESFS
jgi:hypothetical protein